MKDIIKAIRSLENREISLKGNTRKITSQEGGFNFLRQLMTTALPLIKDVHTPLAKNFLVSLGAATTDAAIQKKIFGLGTTTLTMSNKVMDDIMKIVKYPKESSLLIKCVIEAIKK